MLSIKETEIRAELDNLAKSMVDNLTDLRL